MHDLWHTGQGGYPWTLDEEKSRPLIPKALEAGINFFDTANVYSDGTSEEIVGRALKEFIPRDEAVIATKVQGRIRPGPNGAGLSRKVIFQEIDASLNRLGTDYVDLHQIHRRNYGTPVEETTEAPDDLVKAGKARYVGASKPQHLDDAIAALDVVLADDEIAELEAPYIPRPIAGFA